MKFWGYQSYACDNVWMFCSDFTNKKGDFNGNGLKCWKDAWSQFSDDIGDKCALEYWEILGIFMAVFLNGIILPKKYCKEMIELIDWLIVNGDFSYWEDKERRIKRLKGEKHLIDIYLRLGEKVKRGKIVLKEK